MDYSVITVQYYEFIVEFAGETIFNSCGHLAKLQAVASPKWCGGIVNEDFAANLLVNLSVRRILKMGKIMVAYCFLLTHNV